MSANQHPFDLALATRDATAIAADLKLGVRRTVDDETYVINTDLSGQFGGLFVRDLNRNFRLDTGSTAARDGVQCLIDGGGNHFLADEGMGRVTLDFGSGADLISLAVDGQIGILDSAEVSAWIVAEDTDGHPGDEAAIDPPAITTAAIAAGTGFTIYAAARSGIATGAFTVAYRWKN